MTLPGVNVSISDTPAPGVVPPSSGNWFVAGHAERGPAAVPVLVTSLGHYIATFGRRVSYGALYDALDVFFREGGGGAYVSRVVGPAAATASAELEGDDSGGPTSLHVAAASPGEWGNAIQVAVAAASGGFRITVEFEGAPVEISPVLTSAAEAAAWSLNSGYIRLVDQGGGSPIVQSVALEDGDADHAGAGDTEIAAALEAFAADLGPGQVSLPGMTTAEAHEALLEHAHARHRVALVDPADTATVGDLVSAATSLRLVDGHRLAGLFAPWDVVPGPAAGTTRTVAPSARNAALHARALSEGFSVGEPAAGVKLAARYALAPSQAAWSDADREALNDAGVNVGRLVGGDVVTYGNRTPASPISDPNWSQLSQARVIATIAAEAHGIGERFVHSKADGRGITVGRLVGELRALCLRFYEQADLYGDSPEDAFAVAVATDIDSAHATLLATIEARVSPGADRVEIQVHKTPTL